jgi:pentatricopeptide repeat protein
MPDNNFVLWNAMIRGYNHISRYNEALCTFQQMMLEGRFMPDEATLISVVSACTQLGSVEYCNWISSYISKSNTHITVALGNAFVVCKMWRCRKTAVIFNEMKTRYTITWTTMISGFAYVAGGSTVPILLPFYRCLVLRACQQVEVQD